MCVGEGLAQVFVAALGIVGTLAAALLTQWLARRAERERRRSEDETRWLPNRLDVATELLGRAETTYRRLYSAAAFHNAPEGTDREVWLGGHMNLLATPEAGVPDILSAEDREILVEAEFQVGDELEAMEILVSRMALLGSATEAAAARTMYERLWDVEGELEVYAPASHMYAALDAARPAIDAFSAAVRAGLRVEPPEA